MIRNPYYAFLSLSVNSVESCLLINEHHLVLITFPFCWLILNCWPSTFIIAVRAAPVFGDTVYFTVPLAPPLKPDVT